MLLLLQLMYLQLAAADAGGPQSDHVASHVGKAVGMALVLRGTPHHAARRRSYLPLQLMLEHGVPQVGDRLVDGVSSGSIGRCSAG